MPRQQCTWRTLSVARLSVQLESAQPADVASHNGRMAATRIHPSDPGWSFGPTATPARAHTRRGRWKGPRSSVSAYRIFAATMFGAVVGVEAWFDLTTSANIVGPLGVLIWALTLAGHFGVGPVRALWDALRRPA